MRPVLRIRTPVPCVVLEELDSPVVDYLKKTVRLVVTELKIQMVFVTLLNFVACISIYVYYLIKGDQTVLFAFIASLVALLVSINVCVSPPKDAVKRILDLERG
jgi:hypothetical protein